jgi:hypothetical protein
MAAGYSRTPLEKKLGIKPESNIFIMNPPDNLFSILELPAGITLNSRSQRLIDFALLFVRTERDISKQFGKLASRLKADGILWVAWPKKSSGVETDLSFNLVQRIGLETGLVDTKICAIDETWSGLKFVFRLKDRGVIRSR